jgi:hypothetical protein
MKCYVCGNIMRLYVIIVGGLIYSEHFMPKIPLLFGNNKTGRVNVTSPSKAAQDL